MGCSDTKIMVLEQLPMVNIYVKINSIGENAYEVTVL